MAFYPSEDTVFGLIDTEGMYARADDGGAFTDEDSGAADSTANDMTLLPATEEINDAYYFGAGGKFSGVLLDMGTAGVGTVITWEYYDGSSWSTLTISDESSGFTTGTGTYLIAFDPPSDWSTTTINGQLAYWIRARCSTASFSTQPLGTQAWLVKNLVPYISSIDGIPGPRELSEVTALGDGGRKWIPALENTVITLELHWSEDDTSGPDTVLGFLRTYSTAALHWHFGPEGRVTGDIKYSGTCWVKDYRILSRIGDQVVARAELQVNGKVAKGTFS